MAARKKTEDVATVDAPPVPHPTPPVRARHYLQRFDETDAMIWAKRCTVFGVTVEPGSDVDRSKFRIDKLRRLWTAGYVQAKDWDQETARRTRSVRRRRVG